MQEENNTGVRYNCAYFQEELKYTNESIRDIHFTISTMPLQYYHSGGTIDTLMQLLNRHRPDLQIVPRKYWKNCKTDYDVGIGQIISLNYKKIFENETFPQI